MGKERSFTKSEKKAAKVLSKLQRMCLAPDEPPDCINMGEVSRVDVKISDRPRGSYDVRERTIIYKWGMDNWRVVSITIRKRQDCDSHGEFVSLVEDNGLVHRGGLWEWHVVRIEIKGGVDNTDNNNREEGVIVFPDRASIQMLLGNIRFATDDRERIFFG